VNQSGSGIEETGRDRGLIGIFGENRQFVLVEFEEVFHESETGVETVGEDRAGAGDGRDFILIPKGPPAFAFLDFFDIGIFV